MDDNISLGLDLSSFSPEKKKVLQEFITLFETLESYDGKKVSPFSGVGLTEFNKSVSETNRKVSELDKKWNELSLSLKEYKKTSDATATTQAKLNVSTSEQAKKLAEAKVALKEYQRQLNEEAKANNESIKARIAAAEAAKAQAAAEKQAEREKIQAAKEASAEQARIAKEQAKLEKEKEDAAKKAAKEVEAAAKKMTLEQKASLKEIQRETKKAAKEAEAEQARIAKEQAKLEKEKEAAAKKAAKEAEAAAKKMAREQAASLKEIQRETKKAANEAENFANKYKMLQDLLKNQQKAYVNNVVAFGLEDERSKRSLTEVRETQGIISALNEDMKNAAGSADAASRNINKIWSSLRFVAYILPGLGIAGIFNLAFEAIGKAIQNMGFFNSQLEKSSKFKTEFNNILKEQLSLFADVAQKIRELNKIKEYGYEMDKKILEIDKALGMSKKDSLSREYSSLQKENQRLEKIVVDKFGGKSNNKIQRGLNERLNAVKTFSAQVAEAQNQELLYSQIDAKVPESQRVKGSSRLNFTSRDEVKVFKESSMAKLELAKTQYDILKQYADDYVSVNKEMLEKENEITKYNKDEERKKELNRIVSKESKIKSSNDAILDSEKATLAQRLKALKSNYESERRLIDANEKYKTSETGAYDLDGTPSSETDEAVRSASALRISNQNTYLSAVAKLTESYRQRDLSAQEKMDKDELESAAQVAKAQSKNENISLEERLEAYSNYIKLKSRIQEVEYKREKDRFGLVPKEEEALLKNKTEQIKQLRANSSREVYEIVTSWAKKELGYVKSTNQAQVQSDKSIYTQKLKILNDQFSKGEVNYLQYVQRKKAIDAKFRPESIEVDILNQKQSLKRLEEHYAKQLLLRDKFAEESNSLKGQDGEQEAVSKVIGIEDIMKLMEADISSTKDSLAENEFRLEEITYNRRIALLQEFEDNKRRITEQGFQFAEALIENLFRVEERKLQLKGQIYTTQVGVQKQALDQSSLNEKNKQAYSIQLEQQKIEFDKRQALEERKLKRDQALFEQKLALAQIAWNTQVAITRHLGMPKFIIQDIIMGALAAATVLANTIPAYEEGTKGTPHPGGPARIGEKGKLEMVKEPGKSPYFVNQDQITNLPKGTEVFPISDTPVFSRSGNDSNWEQTMMIVSAIKKQKKEIKNIIKPVTKIDMGWEVYKNRVING
jgi:hypothetical protein